MNVKQRIKHFFAQFGSTVVLVGLCAYLILQLTLGIGETVDVEQTTYISVQDALQAEGYLFRDETPLFGGSGTVCYTVEDGQRVSVGTQVAVTYSDTEDATVQEQISEIDRMIRILEQSDLETGAQISDLTILDNRISELTVDLLRQVANDDLAKAKRGEEALWVQLNRKQALLSGGEHLYANRLNYLRQRKADLERSLTGDHVTVQVQTPGYFYHTADGYEKQFSQKMLSELTVREFLALSSAKPDEHILKNACGKLVSNSAWQLAVGTDKKVASAYTEGKSYSVSFPYSAGMTLSMTLTRKILQTDLDTAVLVFESRSLPDGFDFTRNQTVNLLGEDRDGIRVSAKALRMLDGVLGCYVLDGTRVIFKQADVIYRNEEFAVCRTPLDPVRGNRENKSYISSTYLSLYDTVITSGNGLYVGKVLQ